MDAEDERTIAHILSMHDFKMGDNPSYSSAEGKGGYVTGAVCTGVWNCEVTAKIAAFYSGNRMVFAVPWADDQEKKRVLCAAGGELGCSRCVVGKSEWVRKK